MSDDHDQHEPLPEGEEEAPPLVRPMAIVRWALIGLMAFAAVGTWAHFFAPARARQQLYQCPMHPSVITDHPGECPICGMDLVPVSKLKKPAPSSQPAATRVPGLVPIELTPERVRLAGLQTATAAQATVAPGVRTVAFVVPNEKGLAHVHTRYAGWIERLAVAQTGQRVRRGQVLATVYSPDVYAAEQDYLNVLGFAGGTPKDRTDPATRAGARLVEEARHKLELLGVSAGEIEELARTRKPSRTLSVVSSVAGYVTQKTAVAGLYVQPGTELFQVADLSTVWVMADFYERDLARLRVGQAAHLTLGAYPGETFTGTVQFIYPTLDAQSRTARARLEFKNPALKLRPGMYGDVQLDLGAATGLVIPVRAVIDQGDVAYVFVAKGDSRYEPRRVTLGPRTEGKVRVDAGLAAGETVVTTGNFLLEAESRLRAAVEGNATGAEAAAAAAPAEHRHQP